MVLTPTSTLGSQPHHASSTTADNADARNGLLEWMRRARANGWKRELQFLNQFLEGESPAKLAVYSGAEPLFRQFRIRSGRKWCWRLD